MYSLFLLRYIPSQCIMKQSEMSIPFNPAYGSITDGRKQGIRIKEKISNSPSGDAEVKWRKQ